MTKQAELHWIGRAQFKSGYILHRIRSGEKVYSVTIAHARVTSCIDEHGESCKGFKYGKGQCRHAELAMGREQEVLALQEKEREASQAVKEAERIVSPVAAKVQEAAGIRDALRPSEKGVLNGGPKAFRVLA